MKYKLTFEKEKIFWESIASDIEMQLNLGHPSNWNNADAESFQMEMNKVLFPLCQKMKKLTELVKLLLKIVFL